MRHLIGWTLPLVVLLSTLPRSAAADDKPAAGFPLRDGDVWVMAGDSITAQHLHSNYFEAFCFARYPDRKFAFRNSGVGGHTIPSTLARFDYDVAAWKPTVVSVELGMNDQGGTPPDKFVANMATMVERIRGVHARPVIFSPSPINNGDTMAKLGGNKRLHEYSVALREYAAKENIPYADQFHAIIDVWGANQPRERLAVALATLRPLAADGSVAGAEHLRAFLDAQDKAPGQPAVSMHGDAVHPGPPGQLMMAAALLSGLGADGFVSSATIEAGLVSETRGCKVDGLKADGGTVVFDRLDERLPFPIPDDARTVLPLYPTILDLSLYTLKATGLPDGRYALKINGVPTATLAAKDLAAGVNLTAFGPEKGAKESNPIVAQGQAILAAVSAKENVVGQWRALSQRAHAAGAPAELKEQLAGLTKKVEEADDKIRDAAKPQKLHFELSPAR